MNFTPHNIQVTVRETLAAFLYLIHGFQKGAQGKPMPGENEVLFCFLFSFWKGCGGVGRPEGQQV